MPRRCCIPGCTSNYDSTLRKTGLVSTFSIPRNGDKRKSWLQVIRRSHWIPSRSSVVCSEHFFPEDVIRLETIIDNEGTVKNQVLKNPKLREDAIPRIFPKNWSRIMRKSSQLREHDYAAPPEINADTLHPKIEKVTTSCPPALPTTAVSVSKPAGQEIPEQASTKQTLPDTRRRNDAVTNPIKDSDDQRSMNIHQKPSQPVSDNQYLNNMDTAACDELFDNENTLASCDNKNINVTLSDNCHFDSLKKINEVTKEGILQDYNETIDSGTNFKIEQENRDLWVLDDDDDIVVGLDNDDDDFVMNLMASKIEGTDNCGDCEDDEHYVPQQHQGVCCNVCLGDIVGFRYRCCECEDYDICSDCESRQQHPQHYVLRVPGCRKPSEIRRVMAAVHLSLALPPDVKDEPTIKIEDPIEEQPPDPLHTDEPESSPPRPAATHMETDNLMTDPSTSFGPQAAFDSQKALKPEPTLDHLISCKPEKRTIRGEPRTLKLIGQKSDIPVLLDALHRRAFVQLKDVMQKSAIKVCTPTPPFLHVEQQEIKQTLLNIKQQQQKIHEITRFRKIAPKKCTSDFSRYLHNLEDRKKTEERIGRKRPILLRPKPLKQDLINESVTQPLFSLQSTEKEKDDAVLFQQITSNMKDKPIDGGSVIQSEEKMFKMENISSDRKYEPCGSVIQSEKTIIKPTDVSSIVQNREKIFKMIPTDGCSMVAQTEEKLFKMVPTGGSSVVQRTEKFYKMVSTDRSSVVLNKEKIFRMVRADGSTGNENLQNSTNR